MASLTLERKAKYLPALGDNLAIERPFFFWVKAGLPKDVFKPWSEAFGAALDTQDEGALIALFERVATFGTEPLVINGETVDTAAKYVSLCLTQPGLDLLFDFFGAVIAHNSRQGAVASFSARLSGGSFTTPSASPGTAAPASGSGTRGSGSTG